MERSGLYILVTGLATGVFLSSLLTLSPVVSVFLVLLGVTLKIVPHIVRNKNNSIQLQSKYGAIIWLGVLSVAFGMFRVSLWQYFNDAGVLPSFANQKVELVGVVTEEPKHSESSQKIIVAVELVKHEQKEISIAKERVLITVNRYETVSYGDKVSVFGVVKTPQPFVTDTSETFDYGKYLSRQGIFTTMSFVQITVQENNQGNFSKRFLYLVKHWFVDQVTATLPYPHNGLFTGLVISGRSGLSESEQDLFTRVGIVHIVALSGANVTIIVQGLMVSLFFITKKWRLTLGAIGIVAFTIMTGAEPTVVRAAIMGLMAIIATLLVRTYDIGRALFFAAGCMVLYDPMIVYSLSFQLSFLATFALVFVTPFVFIRYEKIIEWLPNKFAMREIIVSSLTIELFLLPLILHSIGETSVIAVFSNLLVLPMLPLAMLTGFIAVMVGVVNYFLALPFIALAYLSLGYIFFVAEFLGRFPFAVVHVTVPLWLMLFLYLVLGCWYWVLHKDVVKENKKVTNALERFNFFESGK